MIIPLGYSQVTHFFGGTALPEGAAITYGIDHAPAFEPELVAAEVHDIFGTEVVPGISSNARLERTLVKFGPASTGASGEYAENIAGTGNSATAPPNVAMLVRKKTLLGGRTGRGRFYLPGVPEESVQPSGVIDSSTVSAFQLRMTNFLAALETYGAPMVLLHNASSDPTVVTNLVVDTKVATQRRRLR